MGIEARQHTEALADPAGRQGRAFRR